MLSASQSGLDSLSHFGDASNIEGPAKVGGVVIPDAQLLFSGDFKRAGLDLVLSQDDRHFFVRDYFKGESRATLLAPDGSSLSGEIVNALTGHVELAQAGSRASAATIIGTVVKLTGDATAVRNGVVVVLNIGDKVYKGDVVQSGSESALGISFIDGTAFSLGPNARMVLNDMLYDPNGSSNSSLLSLVQGTISFVAGETAKNGNMRVDTPVATMGIRGTAVVVEMTANNGPVKFSVVVEPGGRTGSYVLLDKVTGLPISTVSQAGLITFVSATGINQPLSIVEVSKTPTDLASEREIVKLAFSIAFPQFNFDDANPKSKFAFGSSGNNLANGGTSLFKDDGSLSFKFALADLGKPASPSFSSFDTTEPLLIFLEVPKPVSPRASGTITFQDVNPIDISSVGLALKSSDAFADLPGFAEGVGAGAASIGTFSLGKITANADALHTTTVEWTFWLDDSNPVLVSLAQGQALVQIYNVTFKDSTGALLTQSVAVTVTGTNDIPTITAATTPALTSGGVVEDGKQATAGTITFQDVDLIDSHVVRQALVGGSASVALPGFDPATRPLGTLRLELHEDNSDTSNIGTVGWSFAIDNALAQQLAVGQVITQVYTVTIDDQHGGLTTQNVTVTVTGTNDIPTITAATTPASTSGGVIEDGKQTTSGTITFQDVDLIDGHEVRHVLAGGSASVALPGFNPATQPLGTLTLQLAENNTDTDNIGTVGWSFAIDNALAQQLAVGQVITQIYAVTIDDTHGGLVTRNVTVTITGTNDIPTITAATTPAGSVYEDGLVDASGTITFKDIDLIDSHLVTQMLTGGSTSVPGFNPATQPLGTLTLQPVENNTDTDNIGTVNWSFSINNALVQQLAANQIITQTYTVTIDDTHGGVATQEITVTMIGTNDAPVVQDGVSSGQANLSAASGQAVFDGQYFFGNSGFTVTDVDLGATYGIAILGADNANGHWYYQVSGGEWQLIDLAAGKALLLSATDRVKFEGAGSGSVEKLTFKAWDGTDGFAPGTVIDLPSDVGGTSAYSAGTYSVGTKNNGPAGIAGDPINLGLADPSLGLDYTATVTISEIPSDWIVNDGIKSPDGSWTVQTTDLASLSVTTPSSYSGAYLLNVTATVVLADGSVKTIVLGDNVEAYSPGSPIFAWSGDDFLTASSGDDLIVFAQPIGHDIVYSFDVAHDQIDLIGYAGFAMFADVQAHLAEDANGNAVITLSDGQSIVLDGVRAAALTETNFVFDQTPTLDNAGIMTISDGAFMPLSGTIHNTGTISLSSIDDETDLQLIQYGVTLEGGGTILLSDSDRNVISGTSSIVTLDNHDNTISGAGSLGNGELSLTNAGTINATGTHALVIDTGSNVVVNSGTLEASGSGGLMVLGAVENSGFLWAHGANLTVQGVVTGTGSATIDGTGTLDFESASSASVVFGSGTGGTLKLGDAFHFNGTITGFDGADVIDLANFDSGTASISYEENTAGTGGTLTISDGVHVALLSLVGDYSADNFRLAPDQLKGTSITYMAHDLVA